MNADQTLESIYKDMGEASKAHKVALKAIGRKFAEFIPIMMKDFFDKHPMVQAISWDQYDFGGGFQPLLYSDSINILIDKQYIKDAGEKIKEELKALQESLEEAKKEDSYSKITKLEEDIKLAENRLDNVIDYGEFINFYDIDSEDFTHSDEVIKQFDSIDVGMEKLSKEMESIEYELYRIAFGSSSTVEVYRDGTIKTEHCDYSY